MPNNPINPNGLTPEQAANEYRQGDSTTVIAVRWGTNPKQVSRLLERAGCPRRGREVAQQVAREKGRAFTRRSPVGPHKPEHRAAIGRGQAERWAKMTPEQRKAAGDRSAKNLKPGSRFGKEGVVRLQAASRNGSKLALFVRDSLLRAGLPLDEGEIFKIEDRTIKPIGVIRQPGLKKVIVLVYGPSHFRPVFGPEKMLSQQAADQAAINLLASQEYSVLAVQVTKRSLSQTYMDSLQREILSSVPRSKKQEVKILKV